MQGKWDYLVYIDLFAGPGKSQIETTNKIVLASPLVVMNLPIRFDRYIFCEIDVEKMKSLQQRIRNEYNGIDARFLLGNTNILVDKIFDEMPQYGKDKKVLSFCFADPYNLKSLNFSTIQRLSERYMDFLILLPIHMDARRALKTYLRPESENIDNFTGVENWREEWNEAQLKGTQFDVFFINIYRRQMEKLGYTYNGVPESIKYSERNLSLYWLGFFSRHQLGEKFWSAAQKSSNPQLKLDL